MTDPGDLELSASEARVLGALIEKQLTTPDAYPLTLKALTAACNQTSNRDPVVQFDPTHVETAALVLKSKGLLRVVHPGAGERATKYRQIADEVLGLTPQERAVVCVLLLRGAQTAAELRTRTERLHAFASNDEVEATLRGLAARQPPLVAAVDRMPGQKGSRWIQLLEVGAAERAAAPVSASVTPTREPNRIDALEARVAWLEERLRSVIDQLGDLVDPG